MLRRKQQSPVRLTNILEVMKLAAHVEDFAPEADRIHLANGTLTLDGSFTEGRPDIVRSRLPVAYHPGAPHLHSGSPFWMDCCMRRIFQPCRSLSAIA